MKSERMIEKVCIIKLLSETIRIRMENSIPEHTILDECNFLQNDKNAIRLLL